MDLGKTVSHSMSVLKDNLILVVPTVLSTAVAAAMTIAAGRYSASETYPPFVGLAVMVVNFFAHGVTLEMAKEAMEGGSTSLRTGARAVAAYFAFFLVAALIMAVVITVGLALHVIPGVVAIFFLMFTFPSIVADGLGPLEAIKRSFAAVRANLKEAVILFLLLAAISFLFSIGNMFLSVIPVAGIALALGLSGLLGAYMALVVMKAYMEMRCRVVPC
ncbi:MAG: hypothetical protein Kow0025_01030 [Thermodesulfovibrionales bacterium]